MSEASELGDGFLIAYRDLEIRGAGEILGDKQSGCIQSIGYGLYAKLLAEAVSAVSKGEDLMTHLENQVVDIDIGLDGRLPAEYIPHEPTRLSYYKRLAGAQSLNAVDTIVEELTDRFGEPSGQVASQVALAKAMTSMRRLGLKKFVLGEDEGTLVLREEPKVTRGDVFTALTEMGLKASLSGGSKVTFKCSAPTPGDRVRLAANLFDLLDQA